VVATIAAGTTARGYTERSGYYLGCRGPASYWVSSASSFDQRRPAHWTNWAPRLQVKTSTLDPVPDHAAWVEEYSHERDQSTECDCG